ncbi:MULTISPECIES: class I SAM-dependent methyltransferase [Flavobacteriaceae]|uniref:class I SAM-dependent methyltransferase n=1 Tax=Flavobacteriaceae TaxID=49546 RepID=UPI001491BDBD|nr:MULTISPECIES: class I SAM-dependent methyltransferase [Allomuricauda]MDC6367395.1 class I SAM-dependent methyltransferase [Muricauda sp. AC10]
MSDNWLNQWNDRYSESAYAYGVEPNEYLKIQLDQLKTGNILFGAEGEGRNAIYAATQGWTVSAFDISVEGKNKALQLAKNNAVQIDYQIGQLPELGYKNEQFDAIALIYAHFPPEIKSQYHTLLHQYLRIGGTVIFEAFGKNHLEYRQKNEKIGGPKDVDSLFSVEELKADFPNYDILELVETEVELQEGLYHNGKGSVVRFVGRKK